MSRSREKLSRDNDKTTFVMSRSRENNFRYVEITRKLSRDHEKTRQKNYNNAWPLRTSVRQCKKNNNNFTYGQYIFTDCTEDNVQNTHTYTQYT